MKLWIILLVWVSLCPGQDAARKPEPSHAGITYGPHERNVLDLWQPESVEPAPLVVYIHGGGFRGGSKESLRTSTLSGFLRAGISVAAIHYRLVPEHPLPAAHEDARRAIQLLRSRAAEWNLDKSRFGAFGGSAGAQLCMYLAFHDEMADPLAEDPVGRESTRLAAVATSGGQTTMDFAWWFENIPGYAKPHRSLDEYFGAAPEAERNKIIREISALSLISADDPPIHMSYSMAPGEPAPPDPRKAQGWKVHHVAFGQALKERMDQLGIEADLRYPGSTSKYGSVVEFFAAKFAGQTSRR